MILIPLEPMCILYDREVLSSLVAQEVNKARR